MMTISTTKIELKKGEIDPLIDFQQKCPYPCCNDYLQC